MEKSKSKSKSKVEQPWEQEDMEKGLRGRRKTLTESQLTNYGGDFNNGDSSGVNVEEDDEKVRAFSQQNGKKIDEDEQEKKQQSSEYCVYYDTDKGTELHSESSVEENHAVTRENQENGKGLDFVISNQNREHQKHDNFSHELDKSFESHGNNEIKSVDKDGELEVDEFDVETVLKKQETHDLYCPNCNSCITKRVILRKRKRRIQTPGDDAKRNKPETLIPSQVDIVSLDSNDVQARDGVELSLDDKQREPDVFRCLSCLSIFVPTGNGFKLFRMFGNKNDEQNNQISQKSVHVKKGWFSSIFSSDKMETSTDHGAAGHSLDGENNAGGASVLSSNTNKQKGLVSQRQEVGSLSLSEPKGHISEISHLVLPNQRSSGDNNAPFLTQGPEIIEQAIDDESDNTIRKSKGEVAMNCAEVNTEDLLNTSYHTQSNSDRKSGVNTVDQLTTSYHAESNNKSEAQTVDRLSSSYHMQFDSKSDHRRMPVNEGEPAGNASVSPQHDGLKSFVPSNVEASVIENMQMNQKLDVTVQRNGPASPRQEDSPSSLYEPKGQISEIIQWMPPTHSVSGDNNAPFSTQEPTTVEQTIGDVSDSAVKKSKGEVAINPTEVNTVDQLITSYHMQSNSESGMKTVDHSITSYHTQFNSESGANTVDQLTTSYHMESDCKTEVKTVDQSSTSYHTQSDHTSDLPVNDGVPAENASVSLQQNGLKFLVPSDVGSSNVENTQMNQKLDVTVQTSSPDTKDEVSQQHVVQNNVEIYQAKPLQVDKDALTSHMHDALLLQEQQFKLHENLKNIGKTTVSTGKDSIITIESRQLDASAPQTSPHTLAMPGNRVLQHIETGDRAIEEGVTAVATESRSLDVVKSIVYGGLMESIASLSVVASAAGSGATTLNVLALGMANIFGGLFVISHDLWDLKHECTRGASDAEPEQPDRYQQLLGRRADFKLHAAVAFVSYFIFGILPPIVYGFSFRKSNDRDLKLLMVAVASVACIMTLAVGKAHVQRPRKSYFKTIAYYVMFGFMVSGVTFVFGDLIMKLLEKIDVFHAVVSLELPGVSSTSALEMY